MTNTSLTRHPLEALPEDLRMLLAERALLQLVLEAAHAATIGHEPSPGQIALAPGRPRILLTLLTYSYAIGLYSSEEIAERIALDPQLRYLSGNRGVCSSDLRQFRRNQRALLEQALSRVLQWAWPRSQEAGGVSFTDRAQVIRPGSDLEAIGGELAKRRVNEAVFRDTMALDV